MAINRALINRQMYNMGGPALEAGAPDLRLTGDQRDRGSYTQRRRAQMAGGGIMGSNAGSMLVAPTADGSRPGYWGWDDAWETAKKIGQTIIPGGDPGYVDLYGGKELPEVVGDVLGAGGGGGGGPSTEEGTADDPFAWPDIYTPPTYPTGGPPIILNPPPTDTGRQDREGDAWPDIYTPPTYPTDTDQEDDVAQMMKDMGLDPSNIGKVITQPGFKLTDPSTWLGGITGAVGKVAGLGEGQYGKYTIPMLAGKMAYDYQKDYLAKQPKFPADQTSINFQTAAEAMADPNLRFKPKLEDTQLAAQGGRIGYQDAGPVDPDRGPRSPLERLFEGLHLDDMEWEDMDPGFTVPEPPKSPDATPIPEGMMLNPIETMEFRDSNQNGIEDRAEGIYLDRDFISKKDFEKWKKNPGRKPLIPRLMKELNKAQGGRIGYANGTPKIPENLPTDTYLEQLEDFLRRRKDYEDRIMRAPTQEAAQGGRIGFNSGGFSAEDLLVLKQNKYNPSEVAKWKDKGKGLLSTLKSFYTLKADGGRIGYEGGKGVMMASHEGNTRLFEQLYEEFLELGYSPEDAAKKAKEAFDNMSMKQQPKRVMAQEGGLMNLGGMEKDYRQEGGFVPIGGREKADDVPARLSKNEFVFTADAVRAAGGGDIDAGAEVMENLMDNLEAGGKVSEESQGLEGARNMFANAQQLQKRII